MNDPRYLLDPDMAPEQDALDMKFWSEVITALNARDAELTKLAETHNSISFRRECLSNDRALRIAHLEIKKLGDAR